MRGSAQRKIRHQTMDPQAMAANARDAAEFLKALANEQRLAILCSLYDGAKSVSEINERVPLSQSALSQHLALLRERGMLKAEKKSQAVYYAVADDKTRRVLGVLHDCFCGD